MSETKTKKPAKARPAKLRHNATPRVGRRAGRIERFYAQALAIERRAAECYREFARQMADFGNARTEKLFLRLARFESAHAERLLKKTAGMKLPRVTMGRRSQLSEIPSYEFLYHRVLPHHALLMALASERRAKSFFERARANSTDREIRQLAAEFALEEADHIASLEKALAREPQPANPYGDISELVS